MNPTKLVTLTAALLMLCGTLAFAKIFPEEETLDVVYTTDGSVLRGRIVEDVPDEYLTIEIYGGSAFVIAYANVERVREERNSDYGKTPPLLDLSGELFPERDGGVLEEAVPELTQETEDGSTETATDRKGRPFLGHGWLVGPSLTVGRADFYGDDWDATLDGYDENRRYGAIVGIGAVAGYLVPFPSVGVRGAFWGARGSVELSYVNTGFDAGSGTVYGDEGMSYEIGFGALSLPVEAVIGYGGSRLLGYVGAGGGVTLLISDPDSEWRPNSPPVENNTFEFPEFGNPWQPLVQVSAGSIVRLGSRVSLDARVFWQWHLTSFFADTEQNLMITPGLSLGVAWHRKEA